jgi:hypothetical protein
MRRSWASGVDHSSKRPMVRTASITPTAISKSTGPCSAAPSIPRGHAGLHVGCHLSATRDADAAERFFRQLLQASHTPTPPVMTVDQSAAYPPACEALHCEALHQESMFPESCVLRQCEYLNNVVEQDHRSVKRRVNPGLGFGAFSRAQWTIQGYEARPALHKGQLEEVAKGDVLAQNRVINQLFGVAASRALTSFSSHSQEFLQHNHVESHTSSAV